MQYYVHLKRFAIKPPYQWERRNTMDAIIPANEGFVSFRGYKVWYRIVGDHEEPGKLPLLCLHGGLGAAHDYLEPLEAMVTTGRRVIFYDQLGNGNSDHPHNPEMWSVNLFVDEVGVVREALGLERVHIFGQSWGGMLAMEYALTQPKGLISLIIANSLASFPQHIEGLKGLRANLPPEVQAALSKHEAAGTTDDPVYQEAMMEFSRRHVCRLDTWPDCLNRSFEKQKNNEVYLTMIGPKSFDVTGKLKDWNIINRLKEIRVPTVVIAGRYDGVTLEVAETVHRGIPGSEWVVFENSAHFPHIEETERYMQALEQFLSRVEAQM